ncbi:MAG: hypothetical protein WA080_03675 [Sulfuricurvum sp.]
MIQGYITEYIFHLKDQMTIKKFLSALNSLPQINIEKNQMIYADNGDTFLFEIKKQYNPKSLKAFFILKTYLRESEDIDNEDVDNIEIDRYTSIEEIDFTGKDDYNERFDTFKKLQNVINNQIKTLPNIKKIECIRDDYSFILLKKSYPLVYEIENRLRKLIVQLMYFKAEEKWIITEMPPSIKIPENRKESHILGSDFTHLSNMLFEKMSKDNNQALYAAIQANKEYSKLKELMPKSNWDKYFSPLIRSFDEEKLKQLLEKLKKYRNDVAHNKIQIDYEFYEELTFDSEKLLRQISNAVTLLDQEVDETLKKYVIETLQKKQNIPYKKFFEKFTLLEQSAFNNYKDVVNNIGVTEGFIKKLRDHIQQRDETLLKEECIKEMNSIANFREKLILEQETYTKKQVENKIHLIDNIINKIAICPEISSNVIEDDLEESLISIE